MKEQLIREVQRQMLPYLNNAQLKQLQGVLEGVLSGVELSRSAGMVDSAKVIRLPVSSTQNALKAAQKKP